ncbi:homeobox-leucine zipper protein ROC8-like [Apium graveolens]|uniref:homeobox-leucine zipper protein ROC8-like n=1 Tax=Apium graveolens TaxID=4045 RepID=UPI003D7BD6A6
MEALKNVMCPSCRGPDQFGGDTYLKEQKLREENGQLREQLKRYENIVANYKPLMVDVSRNAMDELIKLVQSDSPFWIRSSADGRQVLNLECYESIFPGVAKSPNVRIESSKDSSVVIIDSLELVDMFMHANKWMEFFPNIVSRATTLEVVSSGLTGSRSGLLQLMYEELQVLSPLVPTRKFYFLRFCEQIEQHTWAIVDVSYNFPQEPFSNSQSPVRLLPSGCLIQHMLNGCSKITWIEHMEIEDVILPILEEVSHLHALHFIFFLYLFSVITSTHGKRNLMKLSQRMVKTFCSSINTVNGQQVMISGMNDLEVCAMLQRCTDPGHPNSIVLSTATTISVPFASVEVFNFFRDGRNRPLWDVFSNHNHVKEIGHIACGSHPGNRISVLGASGTSQSNMLILQESCIDSSGALVVYCPIDPHAINIAMSSEDPSVVPILSSGFAISPDTGENLGPGELSAGSLVTIVVQIIMSNLTTGTMSQEAVNTINHLVGNTIRQIKAALNCSTCNSAIC